MYYRKYPNNMIYSVFTEQEIIEKSTHPQFPAVHLIASSLAPALLHQPTWL